MKRLADKVEREKRAAAALPELSLRILERVRSTGRSTVRELVDSTGANRNTIKLHVRGLVQHGRLVQQGTGKSTWYTLLR